MYEIKLENKRKGIVYIGILSANLRLLGALRKTLSGGLEKQYLVLSECFQIIFVSKNKRLYDIHVT